MKINDGLTQVIPDVGKISNRDGVSKQLRFVFGFREIRTMAMDRAPLKSRWMVLLLGSVFFVIVLVPFLLRVRSNERRLETSRNGRLADVRSSLPKAHPSERPHEIVTAGLPASIVGIVKILVDNISDVAFSADGSLLAVGTERGQVSLWSVGESTIKWKADLDPLQLGSTGSTIIRLAFSPDANSLVYICEDFSISPRTRSLHIFELASAQARTLIANDLSGMYAGMQYSNPISAVFSPDGRTLVVGTRKCLIVLDPKSGKELRRFENSRHFYYNNLCFSIETSPLLACSVQPWRVLLFDLTSGTIVAELEKPKDSKLRENFAGVAISRDGFKVAASTTDNEVILWDRTTNTSVAIKEGNRSSWSEEASCLVKFTLEGNSLLTASRGKEENGNMISVRRRDASNGVLQTEFELIERVEPFPAAYPRIFAPNAKSLLSVGFERRDKKLPDIIATCIYVQKLKFQ